MLSLSGKVWRRDPSSTCHKNWWSKCAVGVHKHLRVLHYLWRAKCPLAIAWLHSSPTSTCHFHSAEKGEKHCCTACTAQRCIHHGWVFAHTQSNRGSWRRQDFSLNANVRCRPRKCPTGFFSHVILGTFRFSEKNDALFSHCREESTTGGSVTGVSKPHLQRGRSLVICSWLLAYHCAHVSGSTSVAKIKGSQF